MFERFTEKSRRVLALANKERQRFNHEHLGTEHILLGLVAEGSGVAAAVLKNFGVDLQRVRIEVETVGKSGSETPAKVWLWQASRVKRAMKFAIKEAKKLGHSWVGTEHLLLGLLCDPHNAASQILMNLGLTTERVRGEIRHLLGAE